MRVVNVITDLTFGLKILIFKVTSVDNRMSARLLNLSN
jgi:hypothetical protein